MSKAENSRVHLVISGMVQGVFFRATACEKGSRLGLKGWVKNLHNSDVEIIAEGDKNKLEDLVVWAKHGPDKARVTGLEVDWEEYQDEFKEFIVTY